jgi:hypothetical protein
MKPGVRHGIDLADDEAARRLRLARAVIDETSRGNGWVACAVGASAPVQVLEQVVTSCALAACWQRPAFKPVIPIIGSVIAVTGGDCRSSQGALGGKDIWKSEGRLIADS